VIGSVVAAFAVVALAGVIALVVAAKLRSDMSYSTYRRMRELATFTVFVGLWGALIGCMFWIAS
jgi:hypothetical protein